MPLGTTPSPLLVPPFFSDADEIKEVFANSTYDIILISVSRLFGRTQPDEGETVEGNIKESPRLPVRSDV